MFKFKPYENFILPPVEKIFVIGDIHGDINALLNILVNKIKVLNEKYEWIGGKTVIVQLGDQVDGCRHNCKFTENDTDDINIYPNPTYSQITIEGGKQFYVEIYTLSGKKVISFTGNIIDMSNLPSATYLVKLNDTTENKELIYKVLKK